VLNTTAGTLQTSNNLVVGTAGGGNRSIIIHSSSSGSKAAVLSHNGGGLSIYPSIQNQGLSLGTATINWPNGISYYGGQHNFYIGVTPTAVITDSGDMGIGTTGPAAKLHVGGSAIISSNLTVNGAININGTNITDMIAASTNPISAQTAAAIANATNAIVQAGWLLYDAGSNKWLRVTVSNYSYYISEVL
jgi:hypothetical protein